MPILMDAFRHRLASTKLYRVKGDAFMPTIDVLILATGQHEQIVSHLVSRTTSRLTVV